MQSHSYESMAFASGRECLDGQEVDRADVLIIDVSMPGMDGFELHTLLKASGRNIPTVFISAHINRQYASQAKAVGAVAFVDKPCDEAELLGAVASAIKA
jgi:FixJ family two-component response regulator